MGIISADMKDISSTCLCVEETVHAYASQVPIRTPSIVPDQCEIEIANKSLS